ncbi:uncharacterized protein V1516DRAFT_680422 [Lipomyces oligophaga]|uniref:uncharacterized protein n=1 Tax=Lipomyces oligophaga TaxID=45792 RepID=UPI0034CDEE3B
MNKSPWDFDGGYQQQRQQNINGPLQLSIVLPTSPTTDISETQAISEIPSPDEQIRFERRGLSGESFDSKLFTVDPESGSENAYDSEEEYGSDEVPKGSQESQEVESDISIEYTTRTDYNCNYLEYLNQETKIFMNPLCKYESANKQSSVFMNPEPSSIPLAASTVNMSTHWSGREKELFFEYLGRRSRHDPVSISQEIGTKTPYECAEYISVLEKSLIELKGRERRWRRHSGFRDRWRKFMRAVPAARQMSRAWVRMEEEESLRLQNFLSVREYRRSRNDWKNVNHELAAGEEQLSSARSKVTLAEVHKLHGRITRKAVKLVQKHQKLHPEDEDRQALGALFSPEFQLLNIEQLHRLSEIYYSQDNFPSIIDNSVWRHAIHYSAIQLLHDLVVQYTRRLVATILTVSDIRMRMADPLNYQPKQALLFSDVNAACKIVGAQIRPATDQFWITFRQRNPLIRIARPQSTPNSPHISPLLDQENEDNWFETELSQPYWYPRSPD